MDIDHALEIADEGRAGGYYSITHQALYEMAEAIRYAKAGVEVVDALLDAAGFSVDSSARNQLSIVKSILLGLKSQN